MIVFFFAMLSSMFYGWIGFASVYFGYMVLYFFCSIFAYIFDINGDRPNKNDEWARLP